VDLINHNTEIEHKKKLLQQHLRNLNYLESQAVKYGVDLPLAIHNALSDERRAISLLKRDLATLGASAQAQPAWQAVVVESDDHWRKIITNNITQLGGGALVRDSFSRADLEAFVDSCALMIVGTPPQNELTLNGPEPFIGEMIVNLGRKLPLILLVDWENRETAMVLRQAARDYNIEVKLVTIFKENFDLDWFSRIVHQILTH
jgi:hypothetical protein